jgi:hypothetical protein
MSIEPALTAEEWVRARAFLPFRDPRNVAELTHAPKGRLAAEIALANDALPDTDPRKITRDFVFDMRETAALARDALAVYGAPATWGNAPRSLLVIIERAEAHVHALASYLPPE